MPDVVIHADTVSSPELRHEIPLFLRDPILYVERAGHRHVVVGAADASRVREVADVEVHAPEEFGYDELAVQGVSWFDRWLEVSVRAVCSLGVREAVVPSRFPLGMAERLSDAGVELHVDRDFFIERRRAKTEIELAGIKRAQSAAEAGMETARALLRAARDRSRTVTSEQIKGAIHEILVRNGCAGDELTVARGSQSAIGHHRGSGVILREEPVLIDLFPMDRASGCYADMARTYVVGEPDEDFIGWHSLVFQALHRATRAVRAGVTGKELFDRACDVFENAGFPTLRTKEPGMVLEQGFLHVLGHGVGLALHEEPILDMTPNSELVEGEVLAIEPGLYRKGYGGVRLEDMVLVTSIGCEPLTAYPYDLQP